ncbi:hypothetical protein [Rhodococcus sp. CX]|uniref:hypothetical protein n=1 Tax=Rhodococcus sp. CX TaxID=2789880 RepID=UPI0035A8C434
MPPSACAALPHPHPRIPERLITWLHSMVYDRSLVTDELVEERWRQTTEPATLESARRMYSRAAFVATMKRHGGHDSTP